MKDKRQMTKNEKREYLGALTTIILLVSLAIASVIKLIYDYGF